MDPASSYRSTERSGCPFVYGNSINYDPFRVADLPWKWEDVPVRGQTARTCTLQFNELEWEFKYRDDKEQGI